MYIEALPTPSVQVRVFRFKTGKLFSVFDEGLEIHKEQQQVGTVGVSLCLVGVSYVFGGCVSCVWWVCLLSLVGVYSVFSVSSSCTCVE